MHSTLQSKSSSSPASHKSTSVSTSSTYSSSPCVLNLEQRTSSSIPSSFSSVTSYNTNSTTFVPLSSSSSHSISSTSSHLPSSSTPLPHHSTVVRKRHSIFSLFNPDPSDHHTSGYDDNPPDGNTLFEHVNCNYVDEFSERARQNYPQCTPAHTWKWAYLIQTQLPNELVRRPKFQGLCRDYDLSPSNRPQRFFSMPSSETPLFSFRQCNAQSKRDVFTCHCCEVTIRPSRQSHRILAQVAPFSVVELTDHSIWLVWIPLLFRGPHQKPYLLGWCMQSPSSSSTLSTSSTSPPPSFHDMEDIFRHYYGYPSTYSGHDFPHSPPINLPPCFRVALVHWDDVLFVRSLCSSFICGMFTDKEGSVNWSHVFRDITRDFHIFLWCERSAYIHSALIHPQPLTTPTPIPYHEPIPSPRQHLPGKLPPMCLLH